jgi:hypothetical protein
MEYDHEKVDEAVLALLYLTTSEQYGVKRAWKGLAWEVMDRLHEKGFIDNPKTKALSIVLSEEGAKWSAELFERMFGAVG